MRETPWGMFDVADAHVHFFSPAFFASLADDGSTGGVASALNWELPESSEYLADRWVVEMNHRGVDRAVLIASAPGDIESVGEAVARHPNRFRAVAMLNPSLHAADLRASIAIAEGQIQGVFLFPAMHRFSMHDPRVSSVLATVSGHPGAVAYVHCGMLSVGFRKKLGLACPFDMQYSNPIDLHSAATEFPKLPFVIPHFGAGYLREALMLAESCPNVYFDTSSSNRWMRTDPQGLDLTSVFRRVLQVMGPERLLFGTDSSWFPRGWVDEVFDEQAKALHGIGVDGEAARAIFAGNFDRLFPNRNPES